MNDIFNFAQQQMDNYSARFGNVNPMQQNIAWGCSSCVGTCSGGCGGGCVGSCWGDCMGNCKGDCMGSCRSIAAIQGVGY